MSDSMKEVVETLDPVSRRLIPANIDSGTLVPLKTTLELRDNLTLGLAYITRAPTRYTNDIVTIARALAGDDAAKNLPHLRRCSKPVDLPPHLKSQFMNEGSGRSIHTGKSNWLYILLGPKDELPYDELLRGLASVDGIRDDIFIGIIPVPLLAPTSQVQANLWSQQFWQTVARKSRDAGLGEPIGAVIIKRTIPGKFDTAKNAVFKSERSNSNITQGSQGTTEPNTSDMPENIASHDSRELGNNDSIDDTLGSDTSGPEPEAKETTQIVALAGDARWHQQEKVGRTGNPMGHAALRAISMVAQKLVRTENRPEDIPAIMEFEAFQDGPLLDDEQVVFDAEHPCPDGYLCHDLELYLTHEPCVMCAMAILHSRMGRIVFRHRMPLTGGMSSEDRGYDTCGNPTTCENGPCGGGRGLGLHWRKELNWSMLGWEWETDTVERLTVDAHLHA
ncbi:hypothetical protein CIB48_g3765 [Xylaria polymorpha]|nr:hypothetical protein CIB48_g3765 [Xylaria polymorpha]